MDRFGFGPALMATLDASDLLDRSGATRLRFLLDMLRPGDVLVSPDQGRAHVIDREVSRRNISGVSVGWFAPTVSGLSRAQARAKGQRLVLDPEWVEAFYRGTLTAAANAIELAEQEARA